MLIYDDLVNMKREQQYELFEKCADHFQQAALFERDRMLNGHYKEEEIEPGIKNLKIFFDLSEKYQEDLKKDK